jgi:hypothetical protein
MKKLIFILLVSLGLQTQAQIIYCDSISYTAVTSNSIGYPLILAGYLPVIPGTVTWNWTVCTSNMCYPGTGINAIFQPFSTTDTLKVCYEVLIDVSGFVYACTDCDSFAFNGSSWVLLNMGNPTGVKEIHYSTTNSKIYDLLGRELEYAPIGKMYIRNGKIYISK